MPIARKEINGIPVLFQYRHRIQVMGGKTQLPLSIIHEILYQPAQIDIVQIRVHFIHKDNPHIARCREAVEEPYQLFDSGTLEFLIDDIITIIQI